MIYFRFSVPVVITLLVLSNAMFQSQVHASCNKTQTPSNTKMEPLLKPYAHKPIAPFRLPTCDEQYMKIENGYIIPYFELEYVVTCDEHHALPLGSNDRWMCKSAIKSQFNNNLPELPERQLRVSECIDNQFPLTIYIERGVLIHNADKCEYGVEAYITGMGEPLKRERQFLIQNREFVLKLQHDRCECTILINSTTQVIEGWIAFLTFRLVHKPIYRNLSKSMLDEANCWLAATITEIMVENMKTNPRETYEIRGSDSLFHAGPCPGPGHAVDKPYQKGFVDEVPLCTNEEAINKGLIFIATFHVTYVAFLMWIVRRYIRDNLIMSGRRDDARLSSLPSARGT